MPFRSAALILAVVLAASLTHPAHAQTKTASSRESISVGLPISPSPPGRWRQAVSPENPAKYRCLLGPASDPLCALANRMTCEPMVVAGEQRVPDGMRFCRNAYGIIPSQLRTSDFAYPYLEYRIEQVRIATEQDIENAKQSVDWRNPTPETEPKAGDLLVTVYRRSCWAQPCPSPFDFAGHASEEPIDERAEYCLRQEGTRWRLVWWPLEVPVWVTKWWQIYRGPGEVSYSLKPRDPRPPSGVAP